MSIVKGRRNYLAFDGVNDYVEIPHSNDFNITDKLSYEFWLYADNNQNNANPFIISKNAGSAEYIEAHIQADSGEDYMRFIPNIEPIDTPAGSIDYNQWVHWAVTYDLSGQNVAVYKNGSPISFTGPSSYPSPMTTNSSIIKLGNRTTNDLPLKGFIRDVRIWNTYRTLSEIQENYNKVLTGNETGLVAYYSFTEGSGTTLGDSAGNNDGTIVGATWQSEANEISAIYKGRTSFLTFDGVDDRVQFNTINLTDFTIQAKINITEFTDDWLVFIGDNSDSIPYFGYNQSTSYFRTHFGSFGDRTEINGISMPSLNEDVWITLTNNSGLFELFVNGSLIGSHTNGATQTTINSIGHAYNLASTLGIFKGKFYNLQIFDTDLSQSQLQSYQNTLPTGNEPNLIHYYDFQDGSGTTLTDSVGNNDGTIVGATWNGEGITVPRIYLGSTLVFGEAPIPTYELLADVEVTSNTTQIDFTGLNITKDDELRLVYTFGAGSNNSLYLYANGNTTTSNYHTQRLIGTGTSLLGFRLNQPIFGNNAVRVSGYIDIKVSNNDRFVAQVYDIDAIGSNSSGIANRNANIVGSGFTTSTLTSLTVFSTVANNIAVGSRLQLYKINTGSA